MVQFRLRLFVDLVWTLCPRPIQAARARSVTKNRMFSRSRPLQNTRNALAVLAGAIPWGFKSPSPHHIFTNLAATDRNWPVAVLFLDPRT